MAELASSMPTSGAMYHWACRLGGKGWGWFTAWFNIVGQLAALAGIDYGCALFVTPLIGLPTTTANVLIVYAGDAAVARRDQSRRHPPGGVAQRLQRHRPRRRRDRDRRRRCCSSRRSSRSAFSLPASRPTRTGWPYWWAFVVGLLQAQWTFTGYDASASVSEETVDPRRRVPWGIVMAVVVSSVVGYLLLIALTLAITGHSRRAERARRRRPRDSGGDCDSHDALGDAGRRAGDRAGRDGDVVLRPVGGDLDVARDLRVRARRRACRCRRCGGA